MESARSSSGAVAILILLVVATTALEAAAALPDWSINDYVHTVWTHHDGTPIAPQEFAQTADGYLWFTSHDQVVRFDGMRFMSITVPCTNVYALEAGDNGSLWILCHDAPVKLLRRTPGGVVTEIASGFPSRDGHLRDQRGRFWIFGKGVGRVELDGTYHEIPGDFGDGVRNAAESADGAIWLATSAGVVRLRENGVETVPLTGIWGVASAPDGGVFACAPREGLWHLTGTSPPVFIRPPPGVSLMCTGHALRLDATRGLWATTRQHGVARLQGGRVETSLRPGELGGFTTDVFIDREDNVWVGSSSGLHRFRRPMARLLSSIAEVPGQPGFVFIDPQGEISVGTGSRVAHYDAAARSQSMTVADIRAMATDETGRTWLGMATDLAHFQGRKITAIKDVTGAPVPDVRQFSQDAAGHLWGVAERVGVYQITPGPPRRVFDEPLAGADLVVSARHGTWVALRGKGVRQYVSGREPILHDTAQGPGGGQVLTLADGGDSIWMGDRGGLLRWRNGVWTRWTRVHGLPASGAVHEIVLDRSGRLWLMTSGGIIVASRADLDAMADGTPDALRFTQIGAADRVTPHGGAPRLAPRISIAPNGLLYFATMDSVAIVDPAAITESSLRPTIALESVVLDNESIDLQVTQRFTPPSRMRFEYTSLSLRTPEHARFRHRLEGYDRGWIEAGNERQVTYGTLPPGNYRFRVIGSGGEGVWNEDGALFAFEIVPFFWNTWWFRLTIALVVAAAIASIYRLRVRYVTTQMDLRFEERLSERTRIAREIHDTLLQTVQSSKMVADHALKHSADSTRMVRALEQLSTWLAQATEEGRAAVNSLRSPTAEQNDLADALRRAINEYRTNSRADISMTVSGDSRVVIPEIRDEICQIAFEAIRNAGAHSGGDRIDVSLAYGPDLELRISDNGSGIEPQISGTGREGHFGLLGMRERAGRIGATLTVAGSSGSGTVVTLVVPGSGAFLSGRHQT